jgi:hypothetical protein
VLDGYGSFFGAVAGGCVLLDPLESLAVSLRAGGVISRERKDLIAIVVAPDSTLLFLRPSVLLGRAQQV